MAQSITISSKQASGLLLARMTAEERLGELFRYQTRVLSRDGKIDLSALLGTSMTVTLQTDGGGYKRYFNGMVAEAAQLGFETIKDVRYATYSVTLVPTPWLLMHKHDCRIFSAMSVPNIITTVLGEIGYADYKDSLTGQYPKRDYCVQYRESCFNFISRLMEQEGIYYFFTHTDGVHTMVLADALGAHVATPDFQRIAYAPQGSRDEASISQWGTAQSVHSMKVQLTDYDPLRPKTSLLATGAISDVPGYHGVSGMDVFDYPGSPLIAGQQTGMVDSCQRYAQVRLEALNVPHLQHHGATDACGMSTGALFEMKDFPRTELNQEYLVVSTSIDLAEADYVSGGSKEDSFACRFEVIASTQPFRSMPTATRPQIVGLQTAVVTGSETDEDIVVDKYGRVQVTFHWNKPDKNNAQSSCPVRVASPWAGKTWGAVNIPRVGQEVVVSFLEGDPDRPLIIGSVYNADNMPPYALPDNKTQSGIKSRSLTGAAADANELRFEDKKGSEDFFIHAQKDMHVEVENDHAVTIDHDEIATVKHDRTHTVDNDDKLTVKHDRTHTVDNDDKLTVNNNGTTSIGKIFKLTAGDEIQLICGQASITMKSSGEIDIKGSTINIKGSQQVNIDGQMGVAVSGMKVDLKADMAANLKGTMVTVEGSGKTDVKGAMVNVQGSAMVKVAGGILMLG